MKWRRSKRGLIEVGDRITLAGGYDYDPAWHGGRALHPATVIAFIPGQNDTPALVARLDAPISVDQLTGDIVVLELRWVGARWEHDAVAHIELCDFEPEAAPWQERRQGRWIESHATVLKGSA